jgi:large subunit ribosomal protein L3
MTRLYDEKGRLTTATVIEAGGNRILQVKNADKDGYGAVQVGFGDQKPQRVGKAQTGHFAKTSSTPKKFIREFGLAEGEAAPENADIPVTVFEVGQFVDVIGQSKGKGFQGVVKKHNFDGQPASHGSMMHRRNGAIGNRSTPGRVWKNMGMPGHMGDERVTVQNLRVIQIREDDGVILVSGAVPGANGSNVIVRPAKRSPPKRRKIGHERDCFHCRRGQESPNRPDY